MKKIICSLFAILALSLISCDKDEPGGTATQDVAGEWYVTFDLIDSDGDVTPAADLLDLGWFYADKGIVRTFNTAANVADQMCISDMESFGYGSMGTSAISQYLCFNVKVAVDQAAGTFATEGNDFVQNLEENYGYDPEDGWEEEERFAKVKIVNGKISKNGGQQNNGSPDDTIEFDIYFDNNYDVLVGEFEGLFGVKIDHYHVTGIRYSGLVEND